MSRPITHPLLKCIENPTYSSFRETGRLPFWTVSNGITSLDSHNNSLMSSSVTSQLTRYGQLLPTSFALPDENPNDCNIRSELGQNNCTKKKSLKKKHELIGYGSKVELLEGTILGGNRCKEKMVRDLFLAQKRGLLHLATKSGIDQWHRPQNLPYSMSNIRQPHWFPQSE